MILFILLCIYNLLLFIYVYLLLNSIDLYTLFHLLLFLFLNGVGGLFSSSIHFFLELFTG